MLRGENFLDPTYICNKQHRETRLIYQQVLVLLVPTDDMQGTRFLRANIHTLCIREFEIFLQTLQSSRCIIVPARWLTLD